MSRLRLLKRKPFAGNKSMRKMKKFAGVPSGAAKVGTFGVNASNKDIYICTEASGTWVKINA